MLATKFELLVNSLDEMVIISAAKKFREVMMATFSEWAASEPRFSYDYEASDIVAKSSFMNDSSTFFSSVQGNVRNVTNPLRNPELRNTLAKTGIALNFKLEDILQTTEY